MDVGELGGGEEGGEGCEGCHGGGGGMVVVGVEWGVGDGVAEG